MRRVIDDLRVDLEGCLPDLRCPFGVDGFCNPILSHSPRRCVFKLKKRNTKVNSDIRISKVACKTAPNQPLQTQTHTPTHKNVRERERENSLDLNVKKTKEMLIHLRPTVITDLFTDGVKLERVT